MNRLIDTAMSRTGELVRRHGGFTPANQQPETESADVDTTALTDPISADAIDALANALAGLLESAWRRRDADRPKTA